MKSKTYVEDLKNKSAAESRTGTEQLPRRNFSI